MKKRLHTTVTIAGLITILAGVLITERTAFAQVVPQPQSAVTRVLSDRVHSVINNLTPQSRLPASNQLDLVIGLPLRNRETLTNLLQQLYDPTSTNYHHYLTPEQFTERFGPTEQDYQALVAFARRSGFTVTTTHPNRMLLDVRGQVADVETALHVKMNRYRHPAENRNFFAPDAEPSLALTIPILDIAGLDDFIKPRALYHRINLKQQGANATPMSTGSGAVGGFLSKDFRAAYLPGVALTGTGQTVGLLSLKSGFYQSDITAYEALAGLPNVPVIPVLVDEFNGLGGDIGETSVDIEMAMAMAPGLRQILEYEGDSADDVLNRMATDNVAKQLSASWDWYIDATAQQIFQEFAAQGQSYFSASGDSDAYVGGIYSTADNPYITCVGGTTLTTSGPGGEWIAETVWNWGHAGSGGGISTTYSIPSWQTNLNMSVNQGSTTMRNIPDVSLTADNVCFVCGGGIGLVGGTSCAAPLWAGFTALVNEQALAGGRSTVGFINPAIYAIGNRLNYGSNFHDIITGNNTNAESDDLFYAVPGYDLCTGWGTPAGAGLINDLAKPDVLQIFPTAGFDAIGGVGGPFTIAYQAFIFTNAETNSLSWTVANPASWLSVSPAGGHLGPGGSTLVNVSLNSTAGGLALGTYTAIVWFTNLNNSLPFGRKFTLTILNQPAIITQPSNQIVSCGMSPTLSVVASGSKSLSYQWWLNGTNLPGANKASLTITNAQLPDSGNYFVIVTNVYGSITSSVASLVLAGLPNCAIPALTGLISCWQGNLTAYDIVGTNNGALDGGVTYAPGEVGEAFNFNHTNGFVIIPDSPTFDGLTNAMSFGAWIKVPGWNDTLECIFSKGLPWALQRNWNTNSLLFSTEGLNTVDLQGNIPVDDGNWHYVVAGYDGLSKFIYVDGVLDVQVAASGSIMTSTFPAVIGDDPYWGSRPFTGLIDEVTLYNRALTSNEIVAIYQAGTNGMCAPSPAPSFLSTIPLDQTLRIGATASFSAIAECSVPVAYQWHKNGQPISQATGSAYCFGPTQSGDAGKYYVVASNQFGMASSRVATLSINNPCAVSAPSGLVSWWAGEGNADDLVGTDTGSSQNGVTYAPGEVGYAFSFDGTGSVSIPDSPSFQSLTNAMSFGAWIKVPGWNNTLECVFSKGLPWALQRNWNTNSLLFSTEGLNSVDLQGNIRVDDGNWHYVVASYDGSRKFIYVDGFLDVQVAATGSIITSTFPAVIGDDPYWGSRPFTGMIDEVQIYNRALSVSEIQAIYQAGTNGMCAPTPLMFTGTPSYSKTNGVILNASLRSSQSYHIQANTNLASTNWITLTNFTAGTAPIFHYTNKPPTNTLQQFYRIVSP